MLGGGRSTSSTDSSCHYGLALDGEVRKMGAVRNWRVVGLDWAAAGSCFPQTSQTLHDLCRRIGFFSTMHSTAIAQSQSYSGNITKHVQGCTRAAGPCWQRRESLSDLARHLCYSGCALSVTVGCSRQPCACMSLSSLALNTAADLGREQQAEGEEWQASNVIVILRHATTASLHSLQHNTTLDRPHSSHLSSAPAAVATGPAAAAVAASTPCSPATASSTAPARLSGLLLMRASSNAANRSPVDAAHQGMPRQQPYHQQSFMMMIATTTPR